MKKQTLLLKMQEWKIFFFVECTSLSLKLEIVKYHAFLSRKYMYLMQTWFDVLAGSVVPNTNTSLWLVISLSNEPLTFFICDIKGSLKALLFDSSCVIWQNSILVTVFVIRYIRCIIIMLNDFTCVNKTITYYTTVQ